MQTNLLMAMDRGRERQREIARQAEGVRRRRAARSAEVSTSHIADPREAAGRHGIVSKPDRLRLRLSGTERGTR
jgi:hypothetical protein